MNLISNIGFNRGDATHTGGESDLANLPREPMRFPLAHPHGVFRNIQANQFSEVKCFQVPIIKRVRKKLAGFLR